MASNTITIAPTDGAEQIRLRLFDYQKEVIRNLYDLLREGQTRIAIVAPTGSGKTVMMAQICKDAAIVKRRRVLVCVHLDILVPQTSDKLHKFGLEGDIGFIKAGYPEKRDALVQVASIQTLSRRRWWRDAGFDVVIFDECHQTMFSTIGKRIVDEICPNAKILGFTATPYRLSKREGLGDRLDTLVAAPLPRQLQEIGRLSKMRYFGIAKEGQPDLSNVRTVRGDYSDADLRQACDKPKLIEHIVQQWQRLTPGKRTIAFCVGVDHAFAVAQAFRDVGIVAETVTGETPKYERHRMYDALADGSLTVLTSVNVISIGFDVPAVEVGLLLRPTKSKAVHFQQIGRVMRTAPGKEYGLILDQAGNCLKHGFPESIDEYSLDTGEKKERGEPPVKQCPNCNALINSFERECPQCGHKFPVERDEITTELIELKPREIKQSRAEQAYRSLLKLAYLKGYDPGWAYYRFRDTYPGIIPPHAWKKGAIFGDDPTGFDYELYYEYLQQIAGRCEKDSAWISARMRDEFGKAALIF